MQTPSLKNNFSPIGPRVAQMRAARKTQPQVKQTLRTARKLFESAAAGIDALPWGALMDVDALPLFLQTLEKSLPMLEYDTDPKTAAPTLRVVLRAAARFYEYLTMFGQLNNSDEARSFRGRWEDIERIFEEMRQLGPMYMEWGHAKAIQTVHWFAKQFRKTVVRAMREKVAETTVQLTEKAALFVVHLQKRADQAATEFLFFLFNTNQEAAMQQPNGAVFIPRVSSQLAVYLAALRTKVNHRANESVFAGNEHDMTESLVLTLSWLEGVAKSMPMMLFQTQLVVFSRLLMPFVQRELDYFVVVTQDFFDLTHKWGQSARDLAQLAETLVATDTTIDPIDRDKVRQATAYMSEAIGNFERTSSNRAVDPWLLARLMRDISCDVDLDEDVLEVALEQRFGMPALDFFVHWQNRVDLLKLALVNAYANDDDDDGEDVDILPESLQTEISTQQQLVGGLMDWFRSCRSNRGKPTQSQDDEEALRQAELTRAQEEQIERERGVVRLAKAQLQVTNDKRSTFQTQLELEAETGDARAVLNLIQRGDVGGIADAIADRYDRLRVAEEKLQQRQDEINPSLEANKAYTRQSAANMIRRLESNPTPGQEQMLKDKQKRINKTLADERLVLLGELDSVMAVINKLEYEIGVLESGLIELRHKIRTSAGKWGATFLALTLVAGGLYAGYVYNETLFAMLNTTWDNIMQQAERSGLGAFVSLLNEKYQEMPGAGMYFRWRSIFGLPEVPTLRALDNTAVQLIRDVTTGLTLENAKNVLEPIADVATSMKAMRKTGLIQDTVIAAANQMLNATTTLSRNLVESEATETMLERARDTTVEFLYAALEFMNSQVRDRRLTKTEEFKNTVGRQIWDLVARAWYRNAPSGMASVEDASLQGAFRGAARGESAGFMAAAHTLYKLKLTIGVNGPAMVAVTIFHLSEMLATFRHTTFDVVPFLLQRAPMLLAALEQLSNPIWELAKEGAGQNNANWFDFQFTLLSIAFTVLSLGGYNVGILPKQVWRWLSSCRRAPRKKLKDTPSEEEPYTRPTERVTVTQAKRQPPPVLGGPPFEELPPVNVGSELRQRQVKLEEEVKLENAVTMEAKQLRAETERLIEEKMKAKKRQQTAKAKLQCFICSSAATVRCDHCSDHVYCSEQCAVYDWNHVTSTHLSI